MNKLGKSYSSQIVYGYYIFGPLEPNPLQKIWPVYMRFRDRNARLIADVLSGAKNE